MKRIGTNLSKLGRGPRSSNGGVMLSELPQKMSRNAAIGSSWLSRFRAQNASEKRGESRPIRRLTFQREASQLRLSLPMKILS